MHVQKQMSKILGQFFCFLAIILRVSNMSTSLFSSYVMSLLLQILESRLSLIVLSVFMKVKIVHYLYFQLKRGKYQGEEKTLIASTLTINLRTLVRKISHIDFFLRLLPLEVDGLVMSEM